MKHCSTILLRQSLISASSLALSSSQRLQASLMRASMRCRASIHLSFPFIFPSHSSFLPIHLHPAPLIPDCTPRRLCAGTLRPSGFAEKPTTHTGDGRATTIKCSPCGWLPPPYREDVEARR